MDAAAPPADLGERVYAPELFEENEYYVQSFLRPQYTRRTVLGVDPGEHNIGVFLQQPDSDIPQVLGTTATDNQYFRFWKIQGHTYGPPERSYLKNRVAPKNLEVGRNYYIREGYRPFRRVTINRIEDRNTPNTVYVRTRPSPGNEYGSLYGTGPTVDPRERHKFYKAADVMYKENAGRALFPLMRNYSARPPGTMGPENTGGLLYKRWEQQFQRNRGASRRRRTRRRQTRRRR